MKTNRSGGRDEYLEKQREVLHSDVHLVEIELLRAGEHDVRLADAGGFDRKLAVASKLIESPS